MATVTLARNAVVAKLIDAPANVVTFVTNLLSYEVQNAGVGMNWSGKSSFFETRTMTFPAGFSYLVQAELTKIGHTVHLVKRPHAEPLGPYNPIVDEFGNDDPRYDFQLKALRQVEKHGEGIIRVATGGGKSKIAKLIMARYKRMTLFLTTRGILLYQMDDQLKAIGMSTGQIGDGELRLNRGVNLGMVQTLVQALEETSVDKERGKLLPKYLNKQGKLTISQSELADLALSAFSSKAKRRELIIQMLEKIEVVIGEEAHEAGGDSYYEILKHCKNATIRVALTATPFMRSSAADNMRLMAAFGPILINVSEKLLIDRGILATPYFLTCDSTPHEKLRKTSPYERALTLGYVENTNMHADAIAHAKRARACGLPVLGLVLRVKHGNELVKAYRAAGLKVEFLKGEDDNAVRRSQLQRLAAGELDALIGTTVLDVGVDCPAIGLLQLLGGGKAEVALRQRIGRALRAKKGMPNVAFIIDYTCNLNTYLRDHHRQRQTIIKNTEGFAEGMIAANDDLPWHIFEKAAA